MNDFVLLAFGVFLKDSQSYHFTDMHLLLPEYRIVF